MMRVLSLCSAAIAIMVNLASAHPLTAQERERIITEVIERLEDRGLIEPQAGKADNSPSIAKVTSQVPVTGNIEGDITIYEFLDYGCAPCRATAAHINEFMQRDGAVKVLHHDFPASGVLSAAAASDVLVSWRMGGPWESVRSVYIEQGLTPESRSKAASMIGEGNRDDHMGQAFETLTETRVLAAQLGVDDLPAVIMARGDDVIALSGDITQSQLTKAAALLRSAAQ